MNLYEINESIKELLENGFNAECVDLETGEIDQEKANRLLEGLQEAWDTKLENIGLFIKNIEAEAKAIKEEEKNLADRRKALENKSESLKNYLQYALDLQKKDKFETAKIRVSFRSSQQLVILDETKVPSEFLKVKTEIDKTAIKTAIKEGATFDYATIVDKKNLQIK